MRISYRQGLLSSQSNFLQIGQDDSRCVDIIVSPTPTVATAAFKSVNYLISEQRTVKNAWGPFTTNETQYLYWEINQFNGTITRASTTLPLLVLGSAPENPTVEQMWFDTSENLMKVFNGFEWNPVIRVFAGTLQSGAILQPQPFASQVGLNTGGNAGYVMQDGFGNAFRSSNGALLTSDTQLSSNDTGSLVKIQGSELYALANENIPKFSAVYLIGGRAALASGSPEHYETRSPIAVVTADFYQNETATLITGGRSISNDQWNFSTSDIGKNVYCGANGELTLVKPSTRKYLRIGNVVSNHTVLLTLEWITELVLAENSITNVSVTPPLLKTGSNNIVISLPQASNIYDGFISASDFARIGQLELDLTSKADIGHTHAVSEVSGLQIILDSKAGVVHTHSISDVSNLSNELNARALVSHTHNIGDVLELQNTLTNINSAISLKSDKVIGAVIGHLASLDASGNLIDSGAAVADFAVVSHSHTINDVNGLTEELNLKANINHTQDMSTINGLSAALSAKAEVDHTQEISTINGLTTVLGNKSDVGHAHQISNIDNLQDALDAKADSLHTHDINEVNNLQQELDNKASLVHVHAIGEVTGLQIALDSKSNLNHVHEISEVNGLDGALAAKAASSHLHEIENINGLQLALDDKAPSNHMHTLAANLSDVDVITQSPVVGDSLVWNGTHWVPQLIEGGTAQPTVKFLEGKVFRLDIWGTNARPADNTFMSTYDGVSEEGLSLITWDDNEFSDGIKIPAAGQGDFKNTMWEVTATFRIAPVDEVGGPASWLVDAPGTPAHIRYGSIFEVNSGDVVQLGSAEYDKYVTSVTEYRDIMWTQTVAIKTGEFNDLLFRPSISVGLVDAGPSTNMKFAGSVMVNLKYMGEVFSAPQS